MGSRLPTVAKCGWSFSSAASSDDWAAPSTCMRPLRFKHSLARWRQRQSVVQHCKHQGGRDVWVLVFFFVVTQTNKIINKMFVEAAVPSQRRPSHVVILTKAVFQSQTRKWRVIFQSAADTTTTSCSFVANRVTKHSAQFCFQDLLLP